MEKKAKPPPPPFLVPAVIDALRDSTKFGSLVKLVPGEADGFCAENVRENGGLVLTSDSDLLVYDLGEAGGVVFLADIDAGTDTQTLTAPQYRPADICRRLSLRPDTGLQYLAFEISRDQHLTLEQAVERAKRSEAVSVSREEYSEFIEQYLSPEVASRSRKGEIPPLDPRVSEIVLRSLCASETTTPVSKGNAEPRLSGEAELEMYLPFLLDYPLRTSAWEASKPLRRLAYAVLQSLRGSSIPSVSEMRRLQSVSSGLQVSVPSLVEVDELGTSLVEVLSSIEDGISNPDILWVSLAIYQDILMTMERGKGYPVSLEVLGQATKGKLDMCSWESVHFLAQTQATYYSLRMLRQILDVSVHHTGSLSTTMSKVSRSLSALPPLTDFPSIRTFGDTLRVIRESGALACLQSLCAEYEDVVSLIKSILRPQDNKKSKKRKAVASSEGDAKVTKPRSNNPFDLLSRSGE